MHFFSARFCIAVYILRTEGSTVIWQDSEHDVFTLLATHTGWMNYMYMACNKHFYHLQAMSEKDKEMAAVEEERKRLEQEKLAAEEKVKQMHREMEDFEKSMQANMKQLREDMAEHLQETSKSNEELMKKRQEEQQKMLEKGKYSLKKLRQTRSHSNWQSRLIFKHLHNDIYSWIILATVRFVCESTVTKYCALEEVKP